MSIEGYKPSEDEMRLAENQLTPEEKLQSDAHEEGYKLGMEKNKKILYFELEEPNSNKEHNEVIIEQRLTLRISSIYYNDFKVNLQKLCLKNDVECSIKESKEAYGDYKMELNFNGRREDILNVVEKLGNYK